MITAFNGGDTVVQGIVYAMPGLYGPPNNGEVLPVKMRDRVHLQGQGARGSVIRGDGTFNQTSFFWPACPDLAGQPQAHTETGEVLVDYRHSHTFSLDLFGPTHPLPWAASEESSEMLDGFTLQGGDVQVHFGKDFSVFQIGAPELRGRISNCLFDMRDDWVAGSGAGAVTVQGPVFGIEMAKLFTSGLGGAGGYPDHRVLIANNTFILAEFGLISGTEFDVVSEARPEAVAIIDVTDSGCGSLFINTDHDLTLRGVGNPILVNNLFRTAPKGPPPVIGHFAMLGIDLNDTLVGTGGGATIPSNAFASTRVGTSSNGFSNGTFCSMPVVPGVSGTGINPPAVLLDCHGLGGSPNCNAVATPAICCNPSLNPTPCAAALPPQPAVEIWDGVATSPPTQFDPGFVGEFLSPQLAAPPPRYRDWRLLPGSPVADMGLTPLPVATDPPVLSLATVAPGWTYLESACSELASFDWDHEGFGNPRASGASIDIGFDEFQLFIMAGNYANDSNSHNLSGFLNPTLESGRPGRVMLFPQLSAGANQVTVNGVLSQPPVPSVAVPPPGWITPPRTTIVVNPALPLGFRTRYISFSNSTTSTGSPMGTAMPWSTGAPGPLNISYPIPWNATQATFQFSQFPISDLESSTGYFGAQAVIHAGDPIGAPERWSNLQFEYR